MGSNWFIMFLKDLVQKIIGIQYKVLKVCFILLEFDTFIYIYCKINHLKKRILVGDVDSLDLIRSHQHLPLCCSHLEALFLHLLASFDVFLEDFLLKPTFLVLYAPSDSHLVCFIDKLSLSSLDIASKPEKAHD